MKYLCLAYGAEADWKALAPDDQVTLLAQDELLRSRGALMAAVKTDVVVTVRAWDGVPTVTAVSLAPPPLAGFSVIEAADLDEVIALVARTPCARAQRAVEIRADPRHQRCAMAKTGA